MDGEKKKDWFFFFLSCSCMISELVSFCFCCIDCYWCLSYSLHEVCPTQLSAQPSSPPHASSSWPQLTPLTLSNIRCWYKKSTLPSGTMIMTFMYKTLVFTETFAVTIVVQTVEAPWIQDISLQLWRINPRLSQGRYVFHLTYLQEDWGTDPDLMFLSIWNIYS